MNVKNVKKREILDYKQFLEVAADPFNKKNLSKEDRTGFHKIKPEKPYAYVGWQDPIFKQASQIIGISEQKVTNWMRKNMYDFWSTQCFKRKGTVQ